MSELPTPGDVYRSRWDVCSWCDVVVIVERDDDRGVPDTDEWEAATLGCPLCGHGLLMGNADEQTQVESERRMTGRRMWGARGAAFKQAIQIISDGGGVEELAAQMDHAAEKAGIDVQQT